MTIELSFYSNKITIRNLVEQQIYRKQSIIVGSMKKGHTTDTAPLLFIILAIIIGVATRHFVKKSPFPFTVLLLIIGLVLGVVNRLGYFGEFHLFNFEFEFTAISKSIDFAAHMDPHMLLFIFLPILIFEASYAMDLHTFKKTSTNAILLAVPGILMALGLTAATAMGLKYAGIGFRSLELAIGVNVWGDR